MDTIFPTITVEAGLVPGSPAQSGSALILDNAVLGLLDTGVLGTVTTWTNISNWVNSFSVTRPATRQQGPLWTFQAGTCSIVLDNSDGSFDPDNLNGPYVVAGVSQIDIMVPIRISITYAGVTDYLFTGYTDAWTPDPVTFSGDYATTIVTATDGFKVLSGVTLPPVSITGTGATSGARMRDILSRAGWYTSAEWANISNGNSTMQGTTLGSDALSLMQIASDSEIGRLFMSGTGAVTFKSRQSLLTDTVSNTVQAVFGDSPGTSHPAGTELYCATINRAFDDTTRANDVQATRVGGTVQEVQDLASIHRYAFPRSFSRTDLILQTDSDALNWANWVLSISKGGENRFESIEIDPVADAVNLWPQIITRDIGDRIEVWVRPAGFGPATPVTKDCFITGITHTCDAINYTWRTSYTLQDATKYSSFMTLDNITLGQLDNNALIF